MGTVFPPFEARRAPLWAIAIVIAAQFVFDAFFNFVVFRNHWTTPITRATDGFIQGTFVANAITLAVVVGGIIFWAAKLRARDVGWRGTDIGSAAALTIALWAAVNLGVAFYGYATSSGIALNPSWTKPGATVQFGGLFAQLFGNALYEETIYRGFLTVQAMLWLQRFGRVPALLMAVAGVQAIFALIHVPMLLVTGNAWADIVQILPQLYLAGLILAAIYLLTGNLFVAVGVHALADAYMLIPSDTSGLTGNFGFVYMGVGLAAAVVWRLRRTSGATAALAD